MQLDGTDCPELAMTESGTQKPPVQAARLPCWAGGTAGAGKQCDPLQVQAGSRLGSTTGGPLQGQLSTTGAFFAESHAMVHAPVGAWGFDAVGSKQGTQRSAGSQVSGGNGVTRPATRGKHWDKQRP